MKSQHPALSLSSALDALATACGNIAGTLRRIDDDRADRDRTGSQLRALAVQDANRRAKAIAERGGGLAEMLGDADDALRGVLTPTPIVLGHWEEYLRANEAACRYAVKRALGAVRDGGAEPLDSARLPGINASKRPSVELTERLGKVHADGLTDMLAALPGLILFRRDGDPKPGWGDNFAADAAYFRAVRDELSAVLASRPITPEQDPVSTGGTIVISVDETLPNHDPRDIHPIPAPGLQRSIETILTRRILETLPVALPTPRRAYSRTGLPDATPEPGTRGEKPKRRPKRTDADKAIDEGKIAAHLINHPGATRDQVAAATGISPAHVSASVAWTTEIQRRTSRNAEARPGGADLDDLADPESAQTRSTDGGRARGANTGRSARND